MRARAWLVIASITSAACAHRRGQPIEPAPIVPTPIFDPAADAKNEPGKVETIASPGCTLEARPGARGSRMAEARVVREAKLRVSREAIGGAGEAALVTVHFRSARFTFPVGTDAAVGAEAELPGVKLRGFVARSEVPVFVRPTQRLAGGILTTTPTTPLELVRVEPDAVRVHVPMAGGLLELAPGTEDDTVPCASASASPVELPVPSKGSDVVLDAQRGLEIRPGPDDPPRATLHVPEAAVALPVDAIELSRKGKLALVEIPSSQGFLTGWVPVAAVHASHHSAGFLGPLGGPTEKAEAKPAPDKVSGFECKATLDVVVPARVGEKQALVSIGSIESGTVFAVDDDPKHVTPSPIWQPIRLREVEANVPLLVRESAFEACVKRL